MRNPIATDGAAVTPVQEQTTFDNWYTVQLRRRRRLERVFQRNGGRDERRTTNTGTQNRSNRGKQMRYSRQLGLANMYQYTNSGKVYGDMPPPIDERATLRHVGVNANGIRPYPKDTGMISMCSSLRGLQAGSVSIGEKMWSGRNTDGREKHTKHEEKLLGTQELNLAHLKRNSRGDTNQGAPQPPLWAPGHTA
jgi:hypothetical protein